MEPRDVEMIEEKMAVYGWSVKCVIEMIDAFNRMLDAEITSINEGSSDETPTGLIQYEDEAIARHSATSEDVQSAIEELMSGGWQSSKDGYPITLRDKTLDLAVTALQAYQPWIPVGDRIPTESELRNGMVLAWSTELDEWQVENWGYVEDRPDDYTHWKPLPEPPQKEEQS